MTDDITYLADRDNEVLEELAEWLQASAHASLQGVTLTRPVVSPREERLFEALSLWINTARSSNPDHYNWQWYPRRPDFRKSRLFWRIRSGKPPLPEPPPRAFSCPWYEVVEEDRPHWCSDVSPSSTWEDTQHSPKQGRVVQINQCPYQLLHKVAETEAIVKYGSHRYWLWKGEKDLTGTLMLERPEGCAADMTISVKRWFLQRVVEAPQEPAWFPWT